MVFTAPGPYTVSTFIVRRASSSALRQAVTAFRHGSIHAIIGAPDPPSARAPGSSACPRPLAIVAAKLTVRRVRSHQAGSVRRRGKSLLRIRAGVARRSWLGTRTCAGIRPPRTRAGAYGGLQRSVVGALNGAPVIR